ncbi:endoplasmic reticulum lectin 1 [Galendromus occidentalis]|uniref:Endoplasmic reticulum lectin 1 n=1 Tax=Galendromus occidentalis TaxID=34638 RepID=A0AAJ6QR94_9ACAR|nr:endoplasmic reticulum lectin 1 [Galendromus occidentalis]
MAVKFCAALSWMCLLSTVYCFDIAGVDESILFKIRWKEPLDSLENIPKEGFEFVRMMSADKEPYVCYVPKTLQVEGRDADVRNYVGPTPHELLEPLFSHKVCRYKLDSYWTYQLCHGRSLRQYHEDTIASKVAIMEFYLGKSDPETRKRDNEIYKSRLEEKLRAYTSKPPPKRVESDSDTGNVKINDMEHSINPPVTKVDGIDYPAFVLNMSFGTLCDINGQPRSTQVFYICDELSDHDVHSFEETSTCKYKVVVRTPLLCSHPMFRVGTTPENEISCHRAGDKLDVESVKETETRESSEENDGSEVIERNLNQPKRLQEQERENRDFRATSSAENEGIQYNSDFKNLVDAIERNLKIFFLQDEDDERSELPLDRDAEDLLRILSGDTCLTGGSGWWRYEFCYGKWVTQYHLEKNEKMQEILLGKWNEDKHRQWVSADPTRKVPPRPLYVKHFYSDGDMCAVTGKPRTVEVKLSCKAVPGHPDAVSISLQEPKACEYKLSVEGSIVCSLLTKVDEDGLPEQSSPASGPPAESSERDEKQAEQEKEDPPGSEA